MTFLTISIIPKEKLKSVRPVGEISSLLLEVSKQWLNTEGEVCPFRAAYAVTTEAIRHFKDMSAPGGKEWYLVALSPGVWDIVGTQISANY